MTAPRMLPSSIVNGIVTDLRETIARDGYEVVNVFGDAETPTFSYTVGLTGRGHPELFMAGLQPSLMQGLLRDIVPLAPTLRDRALLNEVANFPLGVRLVPAASARRFLLLAETHYGHPVEAFQIVIPDAAGRFPWEPGCDPTIVQYQSAVIPFAAEQGLRH